MASWMEFIWKVCPWVVIFSFSISWLFDLLTCSGVVVADRKATEGTGWEMAGVEQGGDTEGRDSSVPAQCHCPCPAQLGQFQSCAVPGVLYQLHFSLQARLFSSARISHRGVVGCLELRESWA